MQQVLPGCDLDDPFSDPITEANELKSMGDHAGAQTILMGLCQSDLRCLDAHSHLGNLVYDVRPEEAIRHYEVGLRIAELSLGEGFDGLLPWGLIDNRPFLRCMHGYGMCLWRLERFDQAEEVLERMLWLNPADNQGVRFLIEAVRAGRSWEEHVDEEDSTREDERMDLRTLRDTPPWEWPEGANRILHGIPQDPRNGESDRLLAADLAGDSTDPDDELVDTLLSIVRNDEETEKLRAKAAIALGPVLELADMGGFDDEPEMISEATALGIQDSFRKLYRDAGVPKEVRRMILEASVRAAQDWHEGAIRAAYCSDDEDWQLTAVFCMRWAPGFHDQILEALESTDPAIHYQAVRAAGNWALDGAWPHVAALMTSRGADRPLLLAAIDAVANIRPDEAQSLLADLMVSDDEEIAEAAYDAVLTAELLSGDAIDADDEDGVLM